MIKPVLADDVRRALRAKGFREGAAKKDHEMFHFWLDGQKTSLWVKLSHGAREIRRDEIKNNARAMHVTGEQLYNVLNCTTSPQETVALLRAALG